MLERTIGILFAATMLVTAMPAASAETAPALVLSIPVEGTGEGNTDATISCGGTAPLTTSCQTSTTLRCCSIGMSIIPGLGFTGRITNQISSSTASYTYSCNLNAWGTPLQSYSCTFTGSGFFYIGQTATLRGSTSGTSVGDWKVQLTN